MSMALERTNWLTVSQGLRGEELNSTVCLGHDSIACESRKTSHEAIDLVQAACGPNKSVAGIMNALQRDKKNNTLYHTLRV